MSDLGKAYERVYRWVCGKHPNVRLWHFQWLIERHQKEDLKPLLRRLRGKVLDAGCGEQPYKKWVGSSNDGSDVRLTGLDITQDSAADIIVDSHSPWPFRDGEFDALICLQVMEHVKDLPLLVSEINRVLKPGGEAIITVPFIFNEHGLPDDFRRFSRNGIRQQFQGYELLKLKGQGGIGTSLGTLLLNWIETELNRHMATRFLKGLGLLFWILFSVAVNIGSAILDQMDTTENFYTSVLIHLRKPRLFR